MIKGDAYIRSFAVQLRKALPEEYFAGRDGGDEFIAVLECVDHEKVREILGTIRSEIARYSPGTSGDADQLCGRICTGGRF